MNVVATKPRAKKAPAGPAPAEIETLVMKAAWSILDILAHITCGPASGDFPGRDSVAKADDALCALANWGDLECRVTPSDTMPGLMEAARQHLISAHDEVCSGTHERPGFGMAHAALLDVTFDRTRRLIDAYNGLPGTQEDLCALATFAGAKPFRDAPQPPIRREPAADAPPMPTRYVAQIAGKLEQAAHLLANIDAAPEDAAIYFGLERLVRFALQIYLDGVRSPDFENGSAAIQEAQAVVFAVNENRDDLALHAVDTVLESTWNVLEEWTEARKKEAVGLLRPSAGGPA